MLCLWVCEQLAEGYAGRNVANQLFRAATSVAANYAEACEPESDADFIHKFKIALKELKESRVWLRFASELLCDPFIDEILVETHEIANMIGASMKKTGIYEVVFPLTLPAEHYPQPLRCFRSLVFHLPV